MEVQGFHAGVEDVKAEVARALGLNVVAMAGLSGGCVGEVYRAHLADGTVVVVKVDRSRASVLEREAFMLRYLAEHSSLPAPIVLHDSPRLLVMTHLPGSSRISSGAELHAAELLAALHGISGPIFGLERDTLIGGLHQPNPPTSSWIEFFREHRLLYMGREAVSAGRLPSPTHRRIERLASQLERWLPDGRQPALVHGDVWSGNVLAESDRITGFLDPALYFGDPEIELAFITLFSTFGKAFFDRYGQLRPIQPGFWEERRDLYNLYPLLVHVRLFGGSYVAEVDSTLRRFGV